MNWPTQTDFSDAVRNPDAAFADPDLATGEPVAARPGDSSVVYQVRGADQRNWAVKCFNGPVPGLGRRYDRIQEALDRAGLPAAVEFALLENGVRVGGQHFPILKMEWVSGLPLNAVARATDPATLDDLFRRWVRLGLQLREARVAHGDLQHGNVLLVPGARPGSFVIKLVDYDGMYIPALTNPLPGEIGHPNYQHPARTAESYSPDLDRFPLLVVATALKGLSVIGPRLWDRYDTGDNLLFTAADFRDPAGSPLMRELWRADHPALRTLVGNLALACGHPMAETPWIDELAPDGLTVPLADAEARAAAVALGLLPAVAPPTLSPRPAPSPEVRPEVPPARTRRRVRAAVVAGLLIVCGAVAAVVTGLGKKPDETAQPRSDEQPPTEPRPNATRTPIAPAPRVVVPVPAVAPSPRPWRSPFAGPPGFYRVWARPIADQRGFAKVTFAADGRAVFFATNGRVEVFDSATGEPKVTLKGEGVPLIPQRVWALDGDRVAVFGSPLKSPALWDAKTGAALSPLLAQNPLPPDALATGTECQLSPDGKFAFVGNQGWSRTGTFGPAQYRVVEVATGKVLAGGEWRFGGARFTADGARMLMVESTGRVRWVKIPSGEVEVEWAFPPVVATHILAGMSADGALVNYFGRPGGLPQGNYLLDGKTGRVLRRLAHGSDLDRSVVTADGRRVVAILTEPDDRRPAVVVADARTGAVLLRTPVAADPNDVVQADFTPDGRAVVVHDRTKREIAVYELRGEVPAVPEGVRVPDTLTPVPGRANPADAPPRDGVPDRR